MKTVWNSKVRKREVKSGHKILFLEIPTRRPVDWSAYRKSPYCDLLRIIASNSLILFQKRCRNSINHNNLKQTAISNNERPMNLKNPYAVCPIKGYLSPPSAWYCLTIFLEYPLSSSWKTDAHLLQLVYKPNRWVRGVNNWQYEVTGFRRKSGSCRLVSDCFWKTDTGARPCCRFSRRRRSPPAACHALWIFPGGPGAAGIEANKEGM